MPTDYEAKAREIAQGIRYESKAGHGVRGFSSHHVDATAAAFTTALRAAADEARREEREELLRLFRELEDADEIMNQIRARVEQEGGAS